MKIDVHLPLLTALSLAACATPARMHDEAQLNSVALGCGLRWAS